MDEPVTGPDTGPLPVAEPVTLNSRRLAQRLQAWMLVVPGDALMLVLPVLWTPQHAKAVLLMAAIALTLLHSTGRFRARLHVSVLDELPPLLSRLLAAGAVTGVVFALASDDTEVVVFLETLASTIGLVVLGRAVTNLVILFARRRRIVAHPTVIIGGGARAAEMATLLQRYPQYGLALVGFVDDENGGEADDVAEYLGRVSELDTVVQRTDADVILMADGNVSEVELLDVVRRSECVDCDLLVIPRLPQFHTQVGVSDHIGSIPVMRIRTPSLDGPAWAAKRAFDVVAAMVGLVLLIPVLVVVAIAVRLEGGPGVLFRQDRVGRHGELFQCLKFRTMRPSTQTESDTAWSIVGDDRIGPVGRFLRRTSIDELPQLWSIVRGDMTLIGPRPERPHFVDKFAAEVDRYAHRHRVRAGLTGLAQVSGLRGDTPIRDRARFDNYYIENWSLWLDVKVLLRTVGEVLFAKGR